jgi:hypothetical protein
MPHEAIRTYLLALSRGDRSIAPWRAWCDANQEALTATHGRAGFLRVKFEPSTYVPPWLASLGIACDPVTVRQLAKAASAAGWGPTPDAYGLRGLYAAGHHAKADAKCRRLVRELLREGTQDVEGYLGEGLADLAVDAGALFEDGFVDEARGLAKALATLDASDGHLRPFVVEAEQLLARIAAREAGTSSH